MADEVKKPEENPAIKTNNNPFQQNNGQDVMCAVWNFINQPVIANAGLGAVLYWAIDPKGLKATLENMNEQMKNMVKIIGDQNQQILALKNQIASLSGENTPEEKNDHADHHQLHGYRKDRRERGAGKFYLD